MPRAAQHGETGRGVWRRSDTWLALAVFLGAAYFYGGVSWNQNARLDAIFTFVEPGPHQWTFRIDPFLPDPEAGVNTGDWTRVGEHYYANKAPGTMLLGVLVYAPLYLAERTLGADLTRPAIHHLNAYIINLWLSVLPLALAMVCWSRLLGRPGDHRSGVALALLTFFATPLFPYATQLWGHTTAAAFVMFAVAAAFHAQRMALAGACIGVAMLCDFLVLPVLAGLTVAVGLKSAPALWRFAAGGAAPALILLLYLWSSFGSPFHLPTEGTNPMFVDDQRALGLFGWPSGVALFQLSVGPYRGLLLQAPLVIGAIIGFRRWWRRAPDDPLLWLCAGSSLATLLWVATFNGWHGGATVSARYLIPMLPLTMLSLRELAWSQASRAMMALLGATSVLHMLAIAAVGPLVREDLFNPFFDEVFPRLLRGDLHPHVFPIRLQGFDESALPWRPMAAWNWGDLAGLSGLSRLVPWCVVAGAASVLACAAAPKHQRAEGELRHEG